MKRELPDDVFRSVAVKAQAMLVGRPILAILLLLAMAGRPAAAVVPPIAKGAVDLLLRTSDGGSRAYQLFRPSQIDASQPLPLVIMLHGRTTEGDQDEFFYHWDRLAKTAQFVVAYPSGIGNSWNAGRCCEPASGEKIDDVAFITELARTLSTETSSAPGGAIDPSRVYVAGFSNGGMLGYRLACESSFRFAAIASAEGALESDCREPKPVSFLEIHGLEDTGIPFAGRIGPNALPSSVQSVEPFLKADGCAPLVATTTGVVTTQVATCRAGRTVEVMSVEGLAHQWTEGDRPIDTTQVMWSFFSRGTSGS